MPSFAPSTAARSQPIRCVRCCSKLPAAMLEAFLIWELFNATKRDMVEAPCFDDTRNPTPVMLYLGAFNSIALEGLERGGLLARSFSGCSPGSAGGSRAFLPLAVSFAAPGAAVPPSSFNTRGDSTGEESGRISRSQALVDG